MSTKTNNCSMLLLQALIIIMAVIAISHDYDISFSDGFGYGFGLVAYIIFSFLFSCMIYEMSILKEKRWKSKICKTVKGAFKYFNKCCKAVKGNCCVIIFNYLSNFITLIFSPNYCFVKYFKNKNKESKEAIKIKKSNRRKNYITLLNNWNLIISIVLLAIVFVLSIMPHSSFSFLSIIMILPIIIFIIAISSIFSPIKFVLFPTLLSLSIIFAFTIKYSCTNFLCSFWYSFWIGFIVYRAVSRSFEIIISFGKDAITKENKAGLYITERVELALKSYFEILINFTTAYFLIFYDKFHNIVDAFIYSLGINTLTNVDYEKVLLINKLFINLQVLSVISLVVLSLAMYASGVKKGSNKKS